MQDEKNLEMSRKKSMAMFVGSEILTIFRWTNNKHTRVQYKPHTETLFDWLMRKNYRRSSRRSLLGTFVTTKQQSSRAQNAIINQSEDGLATNCRNEEEIGRQVVWTHEVERIWSLKSLNLCLHILLIRRKPNIEIAIKAKEGGL